MSDGRRKHGHNSKIHGISPTYRSWQSMRARVMQHKGAYGELSIHSQWDSFPAFLADMGERPEGTTIDRIDGRIGYEPSNCRWATPAEQVRNRKHQGGVRWVGRVDKWAAWIGHERRDIYLGYYKDWWDAMCARKSAENQYWRSA